MKAKLLNLVTHPAFISLVLWSIVLTLVKPLFPRYTVKQTNETDVWNYTNYFSDLDNDGQSETIRVQVSDKLQAEILVYRGNKIVDQYNVYNTVNAGVSLFVNDYDSDSSGECYLFTMNDDSVFLTVFDPIKRKGYLVYKRFIDLRGKSKQSVNIPSAGMVSMIDNKQTGNRDIVFYITCGFCMYPRNLYRYYIDADSLIRSPESGASITGCFAHDMNDDGYPEIIVNNQAAGNYNNEKPFSDQYTWLMVLNGNMDFVFPPIQLLKHPSFLATVPCYKEGGLKLVSLLNYAGTDTIASALYMFDAGGNMLAKSVISGSIRELAYIIPNRLNNYKTFFFVKNTETDIEEIDNSFITINKFKIPPIKNSRPVAEIDADGDGKSEFIFQGSGFKSLIIARSDFKSSVTLNFREPFVFNSVSRVLVKSEKPLIYLQSEDKGIFLRYSFNPLYYMKFPLYAAIYAAILIFIMLIFRLQRYRMRTREEMGKQMAMLQMKAIKNQLDPHFTLNVLNSIGSLYASEGSREQADYIFGKYARLIRETVISSDQIIIPLADEMEFIKNYIDLERFRCNNAFSYNIETGPGIDLSRKIPRMLIHTFVENSIKHGLKNAGGNGILKISVKSEPGRYIITIEDNNSDTGRKDEKSTGKGLIIVKELAELYFRLEKVQIKYSLKPIMSGDNQIIGRIVRIEVPV